MSVLRISKLYTASAIQMLKRRKRVTDLSKSKWRGRRKRVTDLSKSKWRGKIIMAGEEQRAGVIHSAVIFPEAIHEKIHLSTSECCNISWIFVFFFLLAALNKSAVKRPSEESRQTLNLSFSFIKTHHYLEYLVAFKFHSLLSKALNVHHWFCTHDTEISSPPPNLEQKRKKKGQNWLE